MGATLAIYLAGGISEASASDCDYPSPCVCRARVTTILDASSATVLEGGMVEIQTRDVFGADLGVEAGQTIVLPNQSGAVPTGPLLIYVVDSLVVQTLPIDNGVIECTSFEPMDIETAAEFGLRRDCDEAVSEEFRLDDWCPTGACEASIGGRSQGLPMFLGLFTLALFSRRRRD